MWLCLYCQLTATYQYWLEILVTLSLSNYAKTLFKMPLWGIKKKEKKKLGKIARINAGLHDKIFKKK